VNLLGPAAIGVVIPARNESGRIDRCLAAVTASVAHLRRVAPAVDVQIVVVADRCTDHTVDLLAGWREVRTVLSHAGRVGAARAAGVRSALAKWAADGVRPERSWIANTDADSVVPVHWLATHWAAAERGAGLLLGTVRPDPGELDDEVADRWYRRHQLTDGHLHVHGANLGVRADWYLAVGGFADVAGDEDVALAAAVSAAGGVVERTGAGPVVTSARLDGRAPAGLAGYLRQLSATPDTVVEGFPA
jgi:glycosyltransferase involved in cell wall biosynthesis